MVFEAGHSGKTQVIRLWRLWILSWVPVTSVLMQRNRWIDACLRMRRLMARWPWAWISPATLNMSDGVSTSVCWKDGHNKTLVMLVILSSRCLVDFYFLYNLIFCRFPSHRGALLRSQMQHVTMSQSLHQHGLKARYCHMQKGSETPIFKVWNITKSVDFQFCTFKLACSCPIGAFAWLWCYCIVAPFKPQLLKQFFLCPRPFDKKPWAKKLAPWRMLHYLNPVQRLNGNGVAIWRHSSAATHSCVKFGSLERLT